MKKKFVSVPALTAVFLLSQSLFSCGSTKPFNVPTLTIGNHFETKLTSDATTKEIKYRMKLNSSEGDIMNISFSNLTDDSGYRIALTGNFIKNVAYNNENVKVEKIMMHEYSHGSCPVFYLPVEKSFTIDVTIDFTDSKFVKLQPCEYVKYVFLINSENERTYLDVDYLIYMRPYR